MKTFPKDELNKILEQWQKVYDVYVPADLGGMSQFLSYSIVQSGAATMFFDKNTTIPPKNLFFPQSDSLYGFKAIDKKLVIRPTEISDKKRVIFGAKHCDVQGIVALDHVFLEEPVDSLYQKRRENTFVCAIRCNAPKATCFCSSMGVDGDKANSQAADVELYDLGERFAIEALTEKGEVLLKDIEMLLKDEAVTLPEVPERTLKVQSDGLAEKLAGMFDAPIWADFMFKCLGCGTCTFVCPTCYCFDINNKLRGEDGIKLRTWDSCMFDEYTLMAGGHNPRTGKKERVRNRFMHKLSYFYENHQMYLCVGCGRCISKCPMNIDIARFAQKVMAEE